MPSTARWRVRWWRMNTEPGVCSLAGAAYVTVWHPQQTPRTIDGGVAVPGLDGRVASGGESIDLEYGGGITTVVGPASVAVPGAPAALDRALRDYGSVDWSVVLQPSIRAAREGFPLPTACHYYLTYSGSTIYARSDDGTRALFDDGRLRDAGSTIRVPHLADTLSELAEDGVDAFYRGDIGRRIVDHIGEEGALSMDDLSQFEPIARDALMVDYHGWRLALNPPPAIGGVVLAAMLRAEAMSERRGMNAEALAERVRIQQAALDYRRDELDLADDVVASARAFLSLVDNRGLLSGHQSSSTVHTSAVDTNGLACSITASSGYGSGDMPAGTGLWLNNCLGELELNRRGLRAGPPGSRLPSNMAPGVGRCGDRVLSFGSPGANRITTALQQFLSRFVMDGLPLQAANDAPRFHVETDDDEPRLSIEEGLEVPDIDWPLRPYPLHSMYFGGVGATSFDPVEGLQASADPRRVGGCFVST